MGKVLVPALGLVVIGVLAWVLMRPPGGGGEGPAVAPASTAVGAGPEKKAPATEEVVEAPGPIRRPPPVVQGALPSRPVPVLPVDSAEEVADEAPQTAPPMPVAVLTDVKDSVRAYFGNLPRSGKMPKSVSLEEVLPRDIIRQLGARPDAPLVMLGHRQVGEKEAYTDILEMSDAYQQVMGVSWLEPDGTERRHYVQLTVPEKASP